MATLNDLKKKLDSLKETGKIVSGKLSGIAER